MSPPPKLIVAVDQVAMLRTSRGGAEPDPTHFAMQAELAGAAGIRAHLRINRHNVSENDVEQLNRMSKTQFFLQMSPHQDVVHMVNGLRPDNLILVAERREGKSQETGLDAALLHHELVGITRNIDRNTRTFLLVDPILDQIKAAAKVKTHGLVISCRETLSNPRIAAFEKKLQSLADAVRLGHKYGLVIHVSGGIHHDLLPFVTAIPHVSAIHVGHQLVARALMLGVTDAVRHFCNQIQSHHITK